MKSVENAEIAFLNGDLEGLHVEPVAGEHALGVAPLRVGGRTAAPGLGLVNDVVVDEGCRVDDLDHRAQPNGALALIVEELGRKQEQGGADSLAPSGAQVFADFGDR